MEKKRSIFEKGILKLKNKTKKYYKEAKEKQEDLFYERFHVFGDSHAKVFRYINDNKNRKYKFSTLVVGGATAMGIVNPNSKTDCLMLFRKKLSKIKSKDARLIFLLGEVDTGFVIWYRAKKYNLAVDLQMKQSIENYFLFIDECIEKGYHNICLLSAPLPTILDNHENFGEIARLRKEVTATIRDRTDLTLRYNQTLKQECEARNLSFLGLDKEMLGEDNLIQDKFRNSNPLDHHCDYETYSSLIIQKLENAEFFTKTNP